MLRDMVASLPHFSAGNHDLHRGCALGKYNKNHFPRSDNKVVSILDLIHCYVCGPMSFVSLSRLSYYVTFIDDYFRKKWIFFMKTKDQVFKRFQEFKALMENQMGKKIEVLRKNNGG